MLTYNSNFKIVGTLQEIRLFFDSVMLNINLVLPSINYPIVMCRNVSYNKLLKVKFCFSLLFVYHRLSN